MDATPPPGPNPYEPPHAATTPPPPARYAMPSTLETVLGVGLVTISSLIAFVATCFPLGFVAFASVQGTGQGAGFTLAMPWIIGLACGVGAGYLCFRLFFRSRRRRLPPPPGESPARER